MCPVSCALCRSAMVCVLTGEVGSATKMKLVISMLMGTVLAGLAESMALAEHIGLDQEEVLKILTLSPVSCPLVRTKGNGKYTYPQGGCNLTVIVYKMSFQEEKKQTNDITVALCSQRAQSILY